MITWTLEQLLTIPNTRTNRSTFGLSGDASLATDFTIPPRATAHPLDGWLLGVLNRLKGLYLSASLDMELVSSAPGRPDQVLALKQKHPSIWHGAGDCPLPADTQTLTARTKANQPVLLTAAALWDHQPPVETGPKGKGSRRGAEAPTQKAAD